MNYDEMKREYINGFSKNRSKGFTIGLEGEYVAVYSDKGKNAGMFGHSIRHDDVVRLMDAVAASDSKWQKTEGGYGLEMKLDGYTVALGTDFGSGTIELGLPPVKSLAEGMRMLNNILLPIINAADSCGITILGLGTSPLSYAAPNLMMKKERYKVLTEVMHPGVYLQSITAANQVHISFDDCKALEAMNMYNGFAPALIALAGNGAIKEGKPSGYQDFRVRAWDLVNLRKFGKMNQSRKGIAPRMHSISEYLDNISEFTPIMTLRDGKYIMFHDTKRFSDFLSAGNATVSSPLDTQSTFQISPRLVDAYFMEGTVWWEARLKSVYGTVEIRAASQQPDFSSIIALAGLHLGLAANMESASDRVAYVSHSDLVSARRDAAKVGMSAKVGKEPISTMVRDMLDISRTGLAKIGEDASALEPLYERVSRGRNPAAESLAMLRRDGIEKLIKHSRLKAM